jgi:hypothetical protein
MDRAPESPRINAEQAIEGQGAVLKGFCGPNWFVDGYEFDPEQALDTWRVYAL